MGNMNLNSHTRNGLACYSKSFGENLMKESFFTTHEVIDRKEGLLDPGWTDNIQYKQCQGSKKLQPN
jgi:hypothetical protein